MMSGHKILIHHITDNNRDCHFMTGVSLLCPSSTYLKDFDPFAAQKEASLKSSFQHICTLATYVRGLIASVKQSPAELRIEFEHLLLVSDQH